MTDKHTLKGLSMNTDPTLITIPKQALLEHLRERRVLDKMAAANPKLFSRATESVNRELSTPWETGPTRIDF